MTTALSGDQITKQANDPVYEDFLRRVQKRFNDCGAVANWIFLTVSTEGLYDVYLKNIPAEDRQFHTCNTCRHFIERFGGLVIVSDNGSIVSALWAEDSAPAYYRGAAKAMKEMVMLRPVEGVFISDDKVWGTPVTKPWTHLSITPPKDLVNKSRLLNAHQLMAKKREDHKDISRALAEFSEKHVDQALLLLASDALYRSEKVKGPADWLSNLQKNLKKIRTKAKRDAFLWREVASAPPGFCQPRGAMIGTLLEDLATPGMSIGEVQRRFKEKMHPLQYQRPQAPPKAGNVVAASKLVEKLGIEPSLYRRHARAEEIYMVWTPKLKKSLSNDAVAASMGSSVFENVVPKAKGTAKPLSADPRTMTWVKFRDTILPTALEIELLVPFGKMEFCSYLTAVNEDAPNILQWDNPFSWYVYHGGSSASNWNLRAGAWAKVTGLSLKPSMWQGEDRHPQHGKGVLLVLEGARETRAPSMCLFPEMLKADLHEVRATIEAFSKSGHPEGAREGSACGLMLRDKADPNTWNQTLKVTTPQGVMMFKLDRWD